MAQYAWVIAVVVAIGLVQFVVYRYLRQQEGPSPLDASGVDSTHPFAPDPAVLGEGVDDGEPATGRRCPACGTINDPAFTFCRRCVGRLGAAAGP